MLGRLHHVIVDCPDPAALGAFWSALLDQPITWQEPDFVVVAPNDRHSGMAFQLAPDHQPPVWGDPGRPQQIHFDVMVDDPAAARRRVLELGGRELEVEEAGYGVYADPAGHPFCLIRRPGWASPLG
jgi:catechol 2,3-dioxygenase-like lactoylglutathione lyase family enzyme